jgi:hypothetical protein
MKELLVSMNSVTTTPITTASPARVALTTEEPNSPPSRKKKSQESSSSSSSSSNTSSNTENQNWQSAVSVMGSFLSGTPNQSALALTSSLMNSKNSNSGGNNTSSNGNSNDQNSANSQHTIHSLEMEIQRLKKYNFEIQKVEIDKLKLQNEELEKALEIAHTATVVAEQWADQEFHILENRLNEIGKEKEEVYHKLELNKIEMERFQKQIHRLTVKSSGYEEKMNLLNHRIENLEKELKETKLNAINPEEFLSLQNKVQELMGKLFHLLTKMAD